MPHDGQGASQPAQDDFTRPWDGGPPKAASEGGLFAAGELLAGRFRIVRLLGRGGMGEVWEAEDLKLGGRVAVKSVRPDSAQVPEALDRFLREVHLARQVTHPNVCRIFDVFQHRLADGRELTFLSMELLEGVTLRQHLDGHGRLAPAEALPLARQMAAGLEAAHQAGVVHRDFKSANVMLVPSPRGLRAVVTDFGLARSGAGETAGLTVTGAFLGTPAYMAPEQVAGEEVTPATDLYALGVVLYEMVTGELPFQGETALSVAVKRLSQVAPSPRTVVPDLDPRWEAVVARCLERRPTERFASAAEVADVLADRLSATRILAPAKRRRRGLLAAAAILALALAAAGGWWAWETWRPLTWDELGVKPARASAAALAHYRDGLDALARGEAAAARKSLEQALAAQGDFPLARAALAEALVRDGLHDQAVEAAQQAFDRPAAGLPPRERRLIVARYHRVVSEWNPAIQAYLELQRELPRVAEYAVGAAESQIGAGRPREAAQTLSLAAQSSDDPRLDLVLAKAAFAFSDFRLQVAAADQALARAGRRRAPRLRAEALMLRGWGHYKLGDPDAALADFQEAGGLYGGLGDLQGQMEVLNAGGGVLWGQDRLAEAKQRYKAALALVADDNPRSAANQLLNLAAIATQQGALAEAQQTYGAVLASYRDLGDRGAEGQALGNLGLVLLGQGRPADALVRFDEALAIARELGSREEILNQQVNRAQALGLRLESAPAFEALREAGQLAEDMALPGGRAAVATVWSQLTFFQGQTGAARRRLEEALAAGVGVASLRLALADVEIEEGRFAPAIALAREARTGFADTPDQQAFCDVLLARAQLEQAGPAAAREAFERAQRRAQTSEDFGLRSATAFLAARRLAAEGRPAEGLQQLAAPLAAARERGNAVLELDARLLQSELELATATDPAGARARLAALEQEARARRYGLVADKAKRLLEKAP